MNRQWQSTPKLATVNTGVPTVVEVKAPHRGSVLTVSVAMRTLTPETSPEVKIYSLQAAAIVSAATWLLNRTIPADLAAINAAYATLPAGNPAFYAITKESLIGADGRLLSNVLNLPYVNQDGSTTFPGMALWFVVLCQYSGASTPVSMAIGMTIETPTFL